MSTRRTMGGHVTNVLPAWVQAMTVSKRLYVVNGTHPGNTTGLLLSSGFPTHFGDNVTGSFGAGWDVMSGYSSGVHYADASAFGRMEYRTGGHTRLQNQALGLDLNAGAPSYSWAEQPTYQTSDTAGANMYYDPGASVQTVGEDGASWNRVFPVKFDGWVYPRALTDGNMGNSVPHGMRYCTVCYVPAAASGSDPLLLAVLGPQGPFAVAYKPANVTDAEWFDPAWVHGSGRRKQGIYVKNLRTGAWSRVGLHPDLAGLGGFAAIAVTHEPYTRKCWVSVDGTTALHYSIDFTGFENTGTVTVGSVVTPAGSHAPNRYCQGAFTAGSRHGHRLWVWPSLSSNTDLVIQDVAAGTNSSVNLSSKGLWLPIGFEKVGTSFDPVNNRMLVIVPDGNPPSLTNGMALWEITIPASYTDVASYTVTKTILSTDAAVPALTGLTMAEFYGKTQYLPRLGVCLVPFHSTMLGFRP